MSDKRTFLRQFWKEKKMIGAMSPSSKFLAKKMLEPINFNEDKVLVELGPGTGVFTRQLVEKMANDAQLFVFELNDYFVQLLEKEFAQDKRVHIIHDSAEHISRYLHNYNCDAPNVILSSLPLANFPDDLRNKLLRSIKETMTEHSKFIQFQYSLVYKNAIRELFKEVTISFTPMNFPPAFVFNCKK